MFHRWSWSWYLSTQSLRRTVSTARGWEWDTDEPGVVVRMVVGVKELQVSSTDVVVAHALVVMVFVTGPALVTFVRVVVSVLVVSVSMSVEKSVDTGIEVHEAMSEARRTATDSGPGGVSSTDPARSRCACASESAKEETGQPPMIPTTKPLYLLFPVPWNTFAIVRLHCLYPSWLDHDTILKQLPASARQATGAVARSWTRSRLIISFPKKSHSPNSDDLILRCEM